MLFRKCWPATCRYGSHRAQFGTRDLLQILFRSGELTPRAVSAYSTVAFRRSYFQSITLRYGAPIAAGALVGVIVGVNSIQSNLERLVYDLPPSPLTNAYRGKLYVPLSVVSPLLPDWARYQEI